MICEFKILNKLLQTDSEEALQNILIEIIVDLGFDKFAYYSETKNHFNDPPLILTNYPDAWVTHYMTNGYHAIDPIHISAKESILPVSWGGDEYIACLSLQQRKLFNEAADYGICVGLTIPIHSPDNFSALTLTSKNNDSVFQQRILKNILFLQVLGLYFHEAVHKITYSPPSQLTKREQECLLLIAKGYSYDITAEKMEISRNTVLHFVKSIKQKLTASNIQHAVAIAVQKNLIDY